jgi:toxin ParE1/3/4
MGNYRLSVAAAADIEDIFEYGILIFGLTQARSYLQAMEKHFAILAENYAIGREAYDLTNGLRRFNYGSHIIFYLIVDNGILVVRVLHQSVDFQRHL